ncbi:MAG: helical backbone metal receptor [Bacteroidota bacterium]
MFLSTLDQLQRPIQLLQPPKRIISTVPSQTELLAYLGLEEQVVGITKFCVHPKQWHQQKTKIGGTKRFHLDRIEALQPDLIIGNKEENTKELMEELMEQYPVWMSDIYNLEDACAMIEAIGQLTDRAQRAAALSNQIQKSFAELAAFTTSNRLLSAAYFIWQRPMMVAASGTFIDEMLKTAGFRNIFHNKARYPEVTIEDIQTAQPEVILLSSEPFPYKEEHIAFFQQICPQSVIRLVDGELFSWYGSRLLNAVSYFIKLHKEICGLSK